MLTLPGYTVDLLLYESRQSRIYRGRRQADQLPVIFKVLNEDSPSPEKRARFQQEYELMRKIDSEAILRAYGLESHHGLQIMILEDFGGTSLNHLDFCSTLLPHQWLDLAIRIVHALAELHRHRIIHKDINPANIVWNCDTGQIKLIDLGIATELTREVPEIRSPDRLEGTLAYLSPEQSGRMNRSMDYRTDFYSLGVTLYELLTGRLPFAGSDALEMVHAHIARQAVPVEQVKPGVAGMISAIIAKLMGKTAEERYQSAIGLQADLDTCLQLVDGGGRIAPFALGSKDFSGRLHISQKLYGRETQIATLLNVFDRASRGPAELLLVAGYSGIGKSALVHEIQKPITRDRGVFIEGKFDQFKRDIPYASISQAFRELMQQVLTKGDDVVAQWKARLLTSLGNNAQAIIEVIPSLEQIIGPQPAVAALPAAQALNRFHNEFRKFVATFATAEQPLVMFLDDLQWADLPSLQLMSLLLRAPATPHLLLIGAYRDNEVTPAHALRLTLDALDKEGVAVHTMTLAPLDVDEITALLCDTLQAEAEQVDALARLCLAKTEGNPFFLNQFLAALVDQKILRPDLTQGGWLWDVDSVRNAGITDNIVDLMVAKLHKLPQATQQVLQGAACLGNTFDLRMLAVVCGLSEVETARRLWEALREEVVIPLNDRYRYAQQPASEGERSLTPSYRFLHDRVHQAANLLSNDAEKAAMHLAIGRLWLATYSQEQQQELLFDLANHLNLGSGLMSDAGERRQLAQLNLSAAQRAKASVAYKPALMYLQTALNLMQESDWQSAYDLMFALHLEAAEAAYLCADLVCLEQCISIALRHAATLLDQVKVHEIYILARTAEGKFVEAMSRGLEVLRLLGVRMPSKPTKLHMLWSFLQLKKTLADRDVDSVLQLPNRTDLHQLAVSKIATKTVTPSYYVNPKYIPFMFLNGVRSILRFGIAETSASSLAGAGVALIGALGEIDEGSKYGEIALRLLDRGDMEPYRTRTIWVVHSLIKPWKKPLHESLAPLKQGYLQGMEFGDLEFAANNVVAHCYYSFYCGDTLLEVEKSTAMYCSAIVHMQRQSMQDALEILRQALLNLMGQSPNPCSLEGEIFDRHRLEELERRAEDRTVMYKLAGTKMMLCYLFRDYRQAAQYAEMAEKFTDVISGFFGIGLFCFYDSLILLALLKEDATSAPRSIVHKVTKNQKKLKKWAQHAPANFLHKWHLVEAELARYRGDVVTANRGYDESIRLAKKHQFFQEEAIAYERAADHYLAQGIESVAILYLQQAQNIYRRWGALAKVRELASRYPRWLEAQAAVFTTTTQTTVPLFNTSDSSSSMLDLAAVLKASQAISQEIVLQNLLQRLMQVAVESAGAQRGVLLLKRDGNWFVEAEKWESQQETTVLQAVGFNPSQGEQNWLPTALFQYVVHTGKSVIVHDGATDKLVTDDPYVQRRQPRSLLIVPILHQSTLTGMLYLENNAASGAFTESRLEVLQLLASQAAISIENARLYADMEERVAARTAELKSMASRDGLTGVANRRAFDERLAEEFGRAHRSGQPLSLLIIDIDHFKQVNDSYGHPVGDTCLQQLGATLSAQCRRSADFVARYGGEEFTMILPDTDLQGAVAFAERVRIAVKNIVLEVGDIRHPITASIGVASALPHGLVDTASLVATADRRLYIAKAAGRNCVMGSDVTAGIAAVATAVEQ